MSAAAAGAMTGTVRLGADDCDAVLAVIAGTFSEDQARRCGGLWNWQYVDNPFIPRGGPVIVGLAREGALVGCVGTIACRVKLGDAIVDGMGVTHPAVSPAAAAKGLASLSVKICAAAFAAAPAVFYGQANGAVTRIWARSCRQRPADMVIGRCRALCRPIRPARQLARRFGLNRHLAEGLSGLWQALARAAEAVQGPFIDRRTAVVPGSVLDDRFDDLWARAAVAHSCLMVRDRTFLRWRFAPMLGAGYTILTAEREGRLDGYCVLRVIEGNDHSNGLIVDILVDPANPAAYGRLIDAAIRQFRAAGVDWAMILEPAGSGLRRTLRSRLFGSTRRARHVIGYDCSQTAAGAPVRNCEGWYFTFADADLEPGRL